MENLLIYHVDIGRWIMCDFSVLNETVYELKLQIEKKTDIPAHKQVILISGGTLLDSSKTVSFYSAGTDTNPFFLFNKTIIDHPNSPSAYIDTRPDIDILKEYNKTKEIPLSQDALNARVSIAYQFSENAKYICNCIEIFINDQHLIHQGWSAAVANLLDTLEKFKIKANLFEKDFKRYLDGREGNINLLNNFNDILLEISKIPLFPALVKNNSDNNDQKNTLTNNKKNIVHQSLLEWVTARQGLSNLEHIVEHCQNSLKQFDEDMLNTVLQEISIMDECSIQNNCSEIKGLEQRLFKLSQFINESKLLLSQQLNFTEAIKSNHTKAVNEEVDISVMSMLLASYDKKLEIMSKNNIRLCDIRNKCMLSKQELCKNIHARLKWLIVIQNKITEIEAIMLLYGDSIKLTQEYLDVVEQLHTTPKIYFKAVAEVVRRRIFSQALLIWSSDLACHMMSQHSDEVAKRKNFQCQIEGHFLNQLFPGLEDIPPAFATRAPPIFDYNLPKLCIEDLNFLIKGLPQIASITPVPNFNAITQFFLSKSMQEDGTLAIESNYENQSNTKTGTLNDIEIIEKKLNDVISTVGINQIDMNQESDEINRTYSNMENYTNCMFQDQYIVNQEHTVQLLKKSLFSLRNFATISINTLRSDLNIVKQYLYEQKLEMDMFYNDLNSKYNTQYSHIHKFIQYIEERNIELNHMKTQINDLESLLKESEEKEQQLRLNLEHDKYHLIQEEIERARIEITKTHAEELDTLKKRFKIVTQRANEQSFSEKNKRNDSIELVNHEAMMSQLKENILLQNEQAIFQRKCYKQKKKQIKFDEKNDGQIIWDNNKKIVEKSIECQKDQNVDELQLSAYDQNPRSNNIFLPEWDLSTTTIASSVFVDLNKSLSFESDDGKLSVTSFNVGDFVLIVWDIASKNYVVYQENKKNLVFLHPESINNLSLKFSSDEIPKPQHFSAIIIQREYCQAVKEKNRYNVKMGNKFFRVKIQLPKIVSHKREREESESNISSVSVTYI